MPYVADLHIHSRFSRACSQNLNIPNLAEWGGYKGIELLGTGDALHPLWQAELKNILKEDRDGTYIYGHTRFVITTELACIYSEGGRVYRIHLLLFFSSLDDAQKLSQILTKKGMNLASDGRPILGLSARQLCEIVFENIPETLIIPAHIWTPWFSLYGANSGYDFFNECFGEFSDKIYGIETGLSSEPAMNWRVADLDKKAILSFSDSHSLPRLGREVTIFKSDPTFKNLSEDIKNQNIFATIEFFPEEGKYHYSGHRECGVVYSPEELKEKGKICPKCGRALTVGVMQRVEDLATRSEADLKLKNEGGVISSGIFPNRPPFRMLVQLEEIIAESLGVAVASKKVAEEYHRLVTTVDNELKLLTKTSKELIAMAAGEKLADGIERVRNGQLTITPGFDNTYGIVKIWGEDDKDSKEQISLF